VGFEDASYDESSSARLAADYLDTVHHEVTLSYDLGELAEQLIQHLDDPIGDFSIFSTYAVSKLAREKVKVALSGDGGDEVFAGYDTYRAQLFDRYYRYLPARIRKELLPFALTMLHPRPQKKGLVNKVKRFVEGAALAEDVEHCRWMTFLTDQQRASLYSTDLLEQLNGNGSSGVLQSYFSKTPFSDSAARLQYVDIHTYLADNILTKVDRMSMAASLEVRVPLLDHRIVEFSMSLPSEEKLGPWQTKAILRRTMASRLPQQIISKPKQGFSVPIKHCLRGPLKTLMTDLLAENTLKGTDYFKTRVVQRWVAEHLAAKVDHSHRLWGLMLFEMWRARTLSS
jgi:asparagine synthase (glutamine-hydrolysing)